MRKKIAVTISVVFLILIMSSMTCNSRSGQNSIYHIDVKNSSNLKLSGKVTKGFYSYDYSANRYKILWDTFINDMPIVQPNNDTTHFYFEIYNTEDKVVIDTAIILPQILPENIVVTLDFVINPDSTLTIKKAKQ